MKTLFARLEPTTDPVSLAVFPEAERKRLKMMDTAIYADAAMTNRLVLFSWHRSDRPDRRRRMLVLNCACYRLEWPKGDA